VDRLTGAAVIPDTPAELDRIVSALMFAAEPAVTG
jgi:hypothetical protein